jgi:glycosyltransferase involved in cell wall biosynthesis
MNNIKRTGINIITKRMSHHAGHSGYDRLIDYIDADRVLMPIELSRMQQIAARPIKPLATRSGLQWYRRESLISEIKAGAIWLAQKNQIFHYLYGENSYRYLGLMQRIKRNNAIVCTYHTPQDKFNLTVRTTRHLTRLDAIIAVSTMQLDFLSKFVGAERTYYVPHGIDVDYFHPGNVSKPENTPIKCLFVGSHLRDLDTLAETARLLVKWREQIQIIAVTSQKNKKILDKGGNITVLTQVNDEDFLRLYQESDMLLLPLLEATANNSILEAMACGLPILSTDLVGVRDYVTEDLAVLVDLKDAKALAEEVIRLSRDEELRKNMSLASRKHALKFRWEGVALQIRDIYKKIQY